jgi:hypothetical protein
MRTLAVILGLRSEGERGKEEERERERKKEIGRKRERERVTHRRRKTQPLLLQGPLRLWQL